MSTFKDYFSRQAAAYADFRPTYPDELFAWLKDLVQGATTAWDCATGNGQAALGIMPHVERVIATDASAPQLAHAQPLPNVHYVRMRAEEAAIASGSVDVVTVAQALHWFDTASFFDEVHRVVRRGGVVAACVVRAANSVRGRCNCRFGSAVRSAARLANCTWKLP